jgi:hypothetical protein
MEVRQHLLQILYIQFNIFIIMDEIEFAVLHIVSVAGVWTTA